MTYAPQEKQKTAQLHNYFYRFFSTDDIRSICFELEVDFDTLRGTKIAQTQFLINEMHRQGRLNDLVGILSIKRPNNFPQSFSQSDFVSVLKQELDNAILVDVRETNGIHFQKSPLDGNNVTIGSGNTVYNISIKNERSIDLLGNLLEFLPIDFQNATIKEARNQVHQKAQVGDKVAIEIELDEILSSIFSDSSRIDISNSVEDIRDWIEPITKKYDALLGQDQKHTNIRIHNPEFYYPYGLFCRDLLNALAEHNGICTAFETEILLKDVEHAGFSLYLRTLSDLFRKPKLHENKSFVSRISCFLAQFIPDRTQKNSIADGYYLCGYEYDFDLRYRESIYDNLVGHGSTRFRKHSMEIIHIASQPIHFGDKLHKKEAVHLRSKLSFDKRFITYDPINSYGIRESDKVAKELDMVAFSQFVIALITDVTLLSNAAKKHSMDWLNRQSRLLEAIYGKN